jgi:hypothetical protein
MYHRARPMALTRGNTRGAYYIRLDVAHPDFHRACGLISACGGCEVVEAAGMVHTFITMATRDVALDLVRGKIGYTVASSFDGQPWPDREPNKPAHPLTANSRYQL